MSDRFPRVELQFIREDDPHPTELHCDEHGRWTIPDLHLGRWTGRLAQPDESPEHQQRTGGRITPDDLHSLVVTAARQRGWTPSDGRARLGVLLLNVEMTHGHLEVEDAPRLAQFAHEALTWLNAQVAPPGRRFLLTDALYLVLTEPGTAPRQEPENERP